MSDELLIKLAFQAMVDDDALPVLQDAIVESGYTDFNVANLSAKLGYLVTENIANNYASAVAAFMLFSCWPTRWPLAYRCWVNDVYLDYQSNTPATRLEQIQRLYEMQYIDADEVRRLLDVPDVPAPTIIESDFPMHVYADPSAPRNVGYLVSSGATVRIVNLDERTSEKESDER